jgi:hypothetical protein
MDFNDSEFYTDTITTASKGLSDAEISGIVIGALSFVGGCIAGLIACIKRRTKVKESTSETSTSV